jgi:hypothetical protein
LGTSKKPARGRPRSAERHASKIAAAEKKVAGRLDEIADALLALSLGHWQERVTKGGRKIVYLTAPDRASSEYLWNRVAGKPTEAVEVTGKSGGPVEAVVFYLPTNGRDEETAARETPGEDAGEADRAE